ncbi:MAG: tetratricopeptide repeat protein [Bacteroidota bacterium]
MKNKVCYLIVLSLIIFQQVTAMPNCYIYKENEKCYEACKEAEKALSYSQGSYASQRHFMKSIELCPEFAFSFFEKAVPFAKRGQMNLWIEMIDKAVELEPETYLMQRGWYHWFFMHNYEKAIADIDRLDELVDYDIGETGDGFYHLNVMKGLCYKGLGDFERAIELIEGCMAAEDYYQRSYDYLHLGVLYLQIGKPETALIHFQNQIDYNDISEAYYYSAMAYKQMNDPSKYKELLELALVKYDNRLRMHNPYRQLVDQIYRVDILEAMELKIKKD